MKVSKDESLTRPYVLEPEDIQRIYQALTSFTNRITFTLSCQDGFKREFSALEDLIAFENSPTKNIKALGINARSNDGTTYVWVRFDTDRLSNIRINIEGEEEIAAAINERLEERVSNMKPWYARMAQLGIWQIYLVIYTFLLVWFLVAYATGKLRPPNSLSYVWPLLIGLLAGIVIGIIANILDWLKRALFPMGVFALGQGAKRHKDKDLIRTTVIIGFLVSFVASVIVALVFST